MNKYCFIDVDTQNDFFEEGALPVPGSNVIKPVLVDLYNLAQEKVLPILATMDSHIENDPEFAEYGFPPHCITNQQGWYKACCIANPVEWLPMFEVRGIMSMKKNTFSIFSNPNMDSLLGKINDYTFVVFGLATEFCVNAAVEGLIQRGKKVIVILDAIKGIDSKAEEETIINWGKMGVKMISFQELKELIESE